MRVAELLRRLDSGCCRRWPAAWPRLGRRGLADPRADRRRAALRDRRAASPPCGRPTAAAGRRRGRRRVGAGRRAGRRLRARVRAAARAELAALTAGRARRRGAAVRAGHASTATSRPTGCRVGAGRRRRSAEVFARVPLRDVPDPDRPDPGRTGSPTTWSPAWSRSPSARTARRPTTTRARPRADATTRATAGRRTGRVAADGRAPRPTAYRPHVLLRLRGRGAGRAGGAAPSWPRRPGVRAVDPAPEVRRLDRAVFRPPLPEQVGTAPVASRRADARCPTGDRLPRVRRAPIAPGADGPCAGLAGAAGRAATRPPRPDRERLPVPSAIRRDPSPCGRVIRVTGHIRRLGPCRWTSADGAPCAQWRICGLEWPA